MYQILDRINSPEDLKKLNIKELNQLSSEIRSFLILNISHNGGHLASNLGVVEITLALHYVFNSPADKIIWDVGHQSYVHKIITGRKDIFNTLRKYHGISGFPKRCESVHDIFETGHSSTSISAALGVARARDLQKQNYSVISVIGDGALSGGMAFEALNDAGRSSSKIIVLLNDNDMSIAHNVGAMSSYLTKIRTNPGYTKAKEDITDMLNRIPNIGKGLAHSIEKIKNSLKYLIIPGVFFEEMGFTYLGPVDGHDLSKLIQLLKKSEQIKGPVFIHAVTVKGKGYTYAEENPEKYHGISPFSIITGNVIHPKGQTYSSVFGSHIVKMADNDKRIVAITAGMTDSTGLEQFKNKYPKRFFDVGIAEQHAVTMAAGLAINGMIPVFAVYSTFLQRAYDQILHDVCIQNLHVIFAIDRAGIVGEDGETHQGVFDLSYLRQLPNMTLMAPKDENELTSMLDLSIKLDSPVAIRYPKGGCTYDFPEADITYPKWEIIKPYEDIVFLCVGRMVEVGMRASEILHEIGIDVGIINARFIKPLDRDMLIEICKRCKYIFTMEDNILSGGFGSSILEFISQNSINHDKIEIDLFGIPDRFIQHGSIKELYDEVGLSPEKIADKVAELIKNKE